MYQAQIDETLKHQREFFENLDLALDDQLFFANLDFPDLKERVIAGLRWGLFLRPNIKAKADSRTNRLEEGHFLDFFPVARINFPEINSLEDVMSSVGLQSFPIFSQKIDNNFYSQEIEVYFSYDSKQTVLKEIRSRFKKVNSSELMKMFELHLTLPSPEFVFNYECLEELTEWQMEAVEDYEKWKAATEVNLKKFYFQIGGNGNKIKTSHQDNYIAQINNELEDGGALFILMDTQGEFEGVVELHP